MRDEDPDLHDALLLVDLMPDDDMPELRADVPVNESYQVMVDCDDEPHQREVYEFLTGKGWHCRVLTV